MDHVLPKGIQACSSQALDPNGSPFIQPTIKVATTKEAVIDYEEIMPCDCRLAVDSYGNHAVQKIICHGPRSYKSKLVSNLLGHVLGLRFYADQLLQKENIPCPKSPEKSANPWIKQCRTRKQETATNPSDTHDDGFVLWEDLFLKECARAFSFSEKDAQVFSRKFLNLVDPLKQSNNLGRSVSKGNFIEYTVHLTLVLVSLGIFFKCLPVILPVK